MNYDQLTTLLLNLPETASVAMLMRHAERPPILDGQIGNDLPITPDGIAASRALGALFGSRIASVRTSPIRRCVETGAEIIAGTNAAIPAAIDTMLGGHSAYVREPEEAWTNWMKNSNEHIVQQMIYDAQLPGIYTPSDVAPRLARYMLDASRTPGVHLFITHDVVLLPTVAHLWKEQFDALTWWPAFLDAAVLTPQQSDIALSYKGITRQITIS